MKAKTPSPISTRRALTQTELGILHILQRKGQQPWLDIEYAIGRGDIRPALTYLRKRGLICCHRTPWAIQYDITRAGLGAMGVDTTPTDIKTRITNYNRDDYLPEQFQHMGRVGLAVYQ